MKTIPGVVLSLGLMLCAVGESNAQPDYRLIPDSTYTYTFNKVSNAWDFTGVSYSFYISGLLDSTLTADNNRVPVAKSIYKYDNGVISEATSLIVTNGSMVQSQHEVFFYNIDQLVERIVTKWVSGQWQNLNRFTYLYNDDGYLKIYKREIWRNSIWNDYAADSLFYDESGMLVERSGRHLLTEQYITRTLYQYNILRKKIAQVRQDFINNDWVNISRTHFYYNKCGTQTMTETEKWADGFWQNDLKTIVFYHYFLEDERKKIPVCHQGYTILILGKALDLHLAHGDCLGGCIGDNSIPVTKSAHTGLNNKSVPFIVYPNPATERLTIQMQETDCQPSFIELIDYSGRVIRSINPGDQIEITLDLNNLRSGNYILRITSDMIYSTVISKN